MNKEFEIVIEKDNRSNQFYGSVPNLPGCYSFADTIEELIDHMREAISLHLETLKEMKFSAVDSKVIGIIKINI